jgi:FMN-dependent NADH-azoreductase
VWGADLTAVEREFTLVGVNPALDAFADQAAAMHAQALDAAREVGRALGALPVAA